MKKQIFILTLLYTFQPACIAMQNIPGWQEIKDFYPVIIKKLYFYSYDYNNIHEYRYCNEQHPKDFHDRDLGNYKIYKVKQQAKEKKIPIKEILNEKKKSIIFNKVIKEIIDHYHTSSMFIFKGTTTIKNKAYHNTKSLMRSLNIFVNFYIKNGGNPILRIKNQNTPIETMESLEKNIEKLIKEKSKKCKNLKSTLHEREMISLLQEFKKYKKKQKIQTICMRLITIPIGISSDWRITSDWHDSIAHKFMKTKCALSKKNKENKNYCDLQIFHAECEIYQKLLKDIRTLIDKLKAAKFRLADPHERLNFLVQEML